MTYRKLLTPITVTAAQSAYQIYVGAGLTGLLDQLLEEAHFSKIILIADTRALSCNTEYQFFLNAKNFQIYSFEMSEELKSVDGAQKIWNIFSQQALDRKALVLVMGGGALSDLVGFAASTYKRGLHVAYLPTTLLAQVDAAIGGKTALNYQATKNMLGTFHSPKFVICDVNLLTSLSVRDLSSGLAEVIKIALIKDRDFFEKLSPAQILSRNQAHLLEAIHRAAELKAQIVSKDQLEVGERKLLNFGHTVGHVFEALALKNKLSLLHGEAVGLGILVEAFISQLLGNLKPENLEVIRSKLQQAGLPLKLPFSFEMKDFWPLLTQDKKPEAGKIHWSLLKDLGSAFSCEVVPDEMLRQALLSAS